MLPDCTLSEEWRPVVGYTDLYSVSNLGRVRRDASTPSRCPGRILKPRPDRGGYLRVALYDGNQRQGRPYRIHRLVAAAFLVPDPERPYVNHLNGIKPDNRAVNLEWVTRAENGAHAARLGLMPTGERNAAQTHPERVPRGEANGNAVWTDADIRAIRAAYDSGEMTVRALAAHYATRRSSIWRITARRAWKHLP